MRATHIVCAFVLASFGCGGAQVRSAPIVEPPAAASSAADAGTAEPVAAAPIAKPAAPEPTDASPPEIEALAPDGRPTRAVALKLVANLDGSTQAGMVNASGAELLYSKKGGELTVRTLATGAERAALQPGDEVLATQRGTYLVKRAGVLVARRAFDGTEIVGGKPPKPDLDDVSVSADGKRYAVTEPLPIATAGMMRAKMTVYDTKTNAVLAVDTWGIVAAGGIVGGALSPSGLAAIWSHSRGPTLERDLTTKATTSISDGESRFFAFGDGLRVRTPESPGFFAPRDHRVWMERGAKRTVLYTNGDDDPAPEVHYADGSKLLLLTARSEKKSTLRVFDATSGKESARISLPMDANVIHAAGKTAFVAIEKDDKTAIYALTQPSP